MATVIPTPTSTRSEIVELLLQLPMEERVEVIQQISTREAEALLFDWRIWARPSQQAPEGSWLTWLVLAGRGFGKTRTGAEWVRQNVESGSAGRIALVAPTTADARDVMIEGEALALDTLVPTPSGWTTMGDLRPLDVVYDEAGQPTTVQWVSPVMYDRPCYRITFANGESVVADANHKWAVRKHPHRALWVRTTQELYEDGVRAPSGDRQFQYAVDLPGALAGQDVTLPVSPYTLGYWLGDGHSYHAAITTMDTEVLEYIRQDGYNITEWTDHAQQGQARTYGILRLKTYLAQLGLLGDKHVPVAYLRASIEDRYRLLQGLMDSDGCCSERGQCEFTNTNERLIAGTAELLASLGIKYSVTIKDDPIHQRLYRIRFTTDHRVFRVERKSQRQRGPSRQNTRCSIVSIEPVDSVPVRCISVDSPNSLFLVGRSMLPTHNSGLLAISPPWFKPIYEPSKRRLTWPNGAIATAYSADEPERLRGPQHDLAWCLLSGTMVRTAEGLRPIENISIGDFVETTEGLQRVLGTSSRIAPLVRVTFANGSTLTGSLDHPILTQRGWVGLAELLQNDTVYTWKDDGNKTNEATTTATRTGRNSTVIESYGQKFMALFQRATTSIISTTSKAMIDSKISWQLVRKNIKNFIKNQQQLVSVPSAVQSMSLVSTKNVPSIALNAVGKPVNGVANSWNVSVGTVEPPSKHVTGTTVVKDVSILGLDGVVHNLRVENQPEFFANGILTHNCDEIAAWRYEEAWDMLMLGLRLGKQPQVVATTTPKPVELVRRLIKAQSTVITKGNTFENAANLSPAFIEQIKEMYEGTRLGQQEIYAEILDDMPGALWTRSVINANRVQVFPDGGMRRIVMGVDPTVSGGDRADETGIIISGKGWDDHMYTLADLSLRATPEQWIRTVVNAYYKYEVDLVVGEVNMGGDLVKTLLHSVDPDIPFKAVRAARGKSVRAEPIAALYERGMAHHIGHFSTLEDQLCAYIPGITKTSPDRLDALVWAGTELMLRKMTKFRAR